MSPPILHLDTHVVVWLYAGEHARFPVGLLERLRSDILRISPIVSLELAYLEEIGKLTEPPERIVGELSRSIGLAHDAQPFTQVIENARRMSFTRDPFDRIIAAQAIAGKVPLATKDARIRAAYPDHTVWA